MYAFVISVVLAGSPQFDNLGGLSVVERGWAGYTSVVATVKEAGGTGSVVFYRAPYELAAAAAAEQLARGGQPVALVATEAFRGTDY